jgi:hypothetical protein
MYLLYLPGGPKRYYVTLRVHSLLTTVYQQNSGNAIYSYQVPYIHVHVMAPGQRLRRLRHVGAPNESLTL